MVRKMYIVPSDYFDSLARKANITDNPLLTAEIQTEKEKENILKKRKKHVSDQDVKDLVKSSQNKLIFDEMRKITSDQPQLQEQFKTISPTLVLQPKIKRESSYIDQPLNEDPFTSALDYYSSADSLVKHPNVNQNDVPATSTPIPPIPTNIRGKKTPSNLFLNSFYKYEPSKKPKQPKTKIDSIANISPRRLRYKKRYPIKSDLKLTPKQVTTNDMGTDSDEF